VLLEHPVAQSLVARGVSVTLVGAGLHAGLLAQPLHGPGQVGAERVIADLRQVRDGFDAGRAQLLAHRQRHACDEQQIVARFGLQPAVVAPAARGDTRLVPLDG